MSLENNPVDQYYNTKTPEIEAGNLNDYAFYLKYGYDMDSLFPLFPIYIFADCGLNPDRRKETFIEYLESLDDHVIRAPGRYKGERIEKNITCMARIISISPDAVDDRNNANIETVRHATSLLKKDLEEDGDTKNLYDLDYSRGEDTWVAFKVDHDRNWQQPFSVELPVPTSPVSTDTITDTKILCYHITEEDYEQISTEDVELLWSFPVLADMI